MKTLIRYYARRPTRIINPSSSPPPPTFQSPPLSIQNIQVRYPISKEPGVLGDYSGAASVLAQAALTVARQLEMMNVLIGYEQANKYVIRNFYGQNVGYIMEESSSFLGTILRQLLHTRRSFQADILDVHGNVVLKIKRPVKWFLNSHISVYTPEDELIGEVKQVWHLWRRQYDLFLKKKQFAYIDSGFLSWDFALQDEKNGLLGLVNRNFSGFARELFTDTGEYAIHMDSTPQLARHLSLDERAVLLSCAITIDIDYFSRHSGIGFFGFGSIHQDYVSNSNDSTLYDASFMDDELSEEESSEEEEE